MKTLRILFTVLSAACIAAFLPVGSLAGWGYAAICAAGAFCFFALMLLCKQSQNNAERTPTALPEEPRNQRKTTVNKTAVFSLPVQKQKPTAHGVQPTFLYSVIFRKRKRPKRKVISWRTAVRDEPF